MDVRFLLHFSGVLFLAQPLSVEGDAGATGDSDCTSGFPSLDRIDAVLGKYGERIIPSTNVQVVIPSIYFSCSGRILSWTFGGEWRGNNSPFTELQIWRPGSGDQNPVYTKVGSTIINVTEGTQGELQLYHYPLTTPLSFEAGDVLGYFRFASHLRSVSEDVGSGHLVYFVFQNNAATNFTDYQQLTEFDRWHVLISVTTEPPGCGCGFMSLERMKLILGLDTIGAVTNIERRQQITPDMRFTCDGMITKWIIGADWGNDNNGILFPELQIWRNSGDDEYLKINGTVININTERSDRVYEYPVSPIPFQAGDILGVFIPRDDRSKIRLRAESGRGPINYYIPTNGTITTSPFSSIDIQQDVVSSAVYHPLVSVEIVVISSPSISDTTGLPFPSMEPTVTAQSDGGGVTPALYISVGVICAVLTLTVILLAIIITVCLCRKRKKNSMNTSDNVAYGVNQNVVDVSDNVAYGVNQNVVDISDNVAYGVNQNVVDISDNVAYGMNQNVVDISDNVAYVASTSGDKDKVAEAYDYVITTGGK